MDAITTPGRPELVQALAELLLESLKDGGDPIEDEGSGFAAEAPHPRYRGCGRDSLSGDHVARKAGGQMAE